MFVHHRLPSTLAPALRLLISSQPCLTAVYTFTYTSSSTPPQSFQLPFLPLSILQFIAYTLKFFAFSFTFTFLHFSLTSFNAPLFTISYIFAFHILHLRLHFPYLISLITFTPTMHSYIHTPTPKVNITFYLYTHYLQTFLQIFLTDIIITNFANNLPIFYKYSLRLFSTTLYRFLTTVTISTLNTPYPSSLLYKLPL